MHNFKLFKDEFTFIGSPPVWKLALLVLISSTFYPAFLFKIVICTLSARTACVYICLAKQNWQKEAVKC